MEDDLRVHIGGIKFSEKLVQLTVACNSSDVSPIYDLLHLISEQYINIPFLCHSGITDTAEISFCIETSEFASVQQILKQCHLQFTQVIIIPAVGTLTLFPHRNSLRLMGCIVQLFGQYRFPLYSLSTSISAVAVTTDFILLDEIAEKLQKVFSLPDNHAPFRQDFRINQISQ